MVVNLTHGFDGLLVALALTIALRGALWLHNAGHIPFSLRGDRRGYKPYATLTGEDHDPHGY